MHRHCEWAELLPKRTADSIDGGELTDTKRRHNGGNSFDSGISIRCVA
jgi:hypothetical protein